LGKKYEKLVFEVNSIGRDFKLLQKKRESLESQGKKEEARELLKPLLEKTNLHSQKSHEMKKVLRELKSMEFRFKQEIHESHQNIKEKKGFEDPHLIAQEVKQELRKKGLTVYDCKLLESMIEDHEKSFFQDIRVFSRKKKR
jgi:hypothetical protein